MTVTAADYAAVQTKCRFALAHGGEHRGTDLVQILSVVEHAASGVDVDVSTARAATAALEALLVTLATAVDTAESDQDLLETQLGIAFGAWDAAGVGDSSTANTAAHAACDTLRTNLVTSAEAALTAKTACATPRTTVTTAMATLGTDTTGVSAAMAASSDILDGRAA